MSFETLIIGFALVLAAVLIFVSSLNPEEEDLTKKVRSTRKSR